MKNSFLTGQRVCFRPVEKTDAALVASWINNPTVWRGTRQYRPLNLQAEEAFLDKVKDSDKDIVFMIVAVETEAPVGVTGLHKIDARNRHAEFGIAIGDPDEWGKGYGTDATRLLMQYAFETLNLNRVCLQVYEDNARAIRAYEKVGFKREGVLRQEVFREGRYGNTIVMGLLREEWGKVEY